MEYQKVDLTCVPFEGYQIDTNGIVYGRKGQPLRPNVMYKGYLLVKLSSHCHTKTYQIHRLVAMQFIDNPLNKPTVNHKDGNHKNNCIENLEWATNKEQSIHAKEVLGISFGGNKKPIVAKHKKTCKVLFFKSQQEAAEFIKCTPEQISQAVNNSKNSVYGWVVCPYVDNYEYILDEKIKNTRRGNHRTLPIVSYTDDGHIVKVYEYSSLVSRDGFILSNVLRCCRGKMLHHHGLMWKFLYK